MTHDSILGQPPGLSVLVTPGRARCSLRRAIVHIGAFNGLCLTPALWQTALKHSPDPGNTKLSSRSFAALWPSSASRPFERDFEESAFRNDYRRQGREVAIILMLAGALAATVAAISGALAGEFGNGLVALIALAFVAGAIATLTLPLATPRALQLAVFAPILVAACATGLLVALASPAAGPAAHEPAVLVLATAAVALLCRLLVVEIATLTVAVSVIMLITLSFSTPSPEPSVVLAIASAVTLAIGLSVRLEARERQNWAAHANSAQELRRLRRQRHEPAGGTAERSANAERLFGGEHATGDVDVITLVAELLGSHASAAERAGVRLHLRAPQHGSVRARTNAIGLTQVVSSLVSNGIQYTRTDPATRPCVLVAVTPIADEIRISVIDNGIGVAPQLHRRVFDAYFRAPEVIGRTPGAGLGLYCAARVVQQLDDHRLRLRSQQGRGTRVNLYLPRIPTVVRANSAGQPASPTVQ